MKMPAWSWSSLNNYLTCPNQYHALRVEKRFKQEETEHTRWGNEVHKALEERVKDGKPLPERMQMFSEYADSLCAGSGDTYVELKLAINYNLEPVDFFSSDAWSRCVVDFLRINRNKGLGLDHKSGKRREGSRQLKQNAGIIFANFPDLEELTTGYAWLQEQCKIGGLESYTRKDIPSIWKSFREDLEKLEWSYINNAWPKQTSGLCKRWCPVTDCAHNGNYKRPSGETK